MRTEALRGTLLIVTVIEYDLTDDQRAKLRRLLSEVTGRKVTGEVVVDVSQGTPCTLKTRTRVRQAE